MELSLLWAVHPGSEIWTDSAICWSFGQSGLSPSVKLVSTCWISSWLMVPTQHLWLTKQPLSVVIPRQLRLRLKLGKYCLPAMEQECEQGNLKAKKKKKSKKFVDGKSNKCVAWIYRINVSLNMNWKYLPSLELSQNVPVNPRLAVKIQ